MNATPAKGTRLRARVTLLELVLSQAPTSSGSFGIESHKSQRLHISKTENRMPAIAAARGVLRPARTRGTSGLARTAVASPIVATQS
jgi:hypothetical protein